MSNGTAEVRFPHVEVVPSSSMPEVEYLVTIASAEGPVSCQCKGWMYRAGIVPCRHVREVVERLMDALRCMYCGHAAAAHGESMPSEPLRYCNGCGSGFDQHVYRPREAVAS